MKRFTKPMNSAALRIVFPIIILVLSLTDVNGQYQDFRSWWSGKVSYELTDELEASLDLGQRFRSNSLVYDKTLVTAGLEYEIINDLKIEGGYRFVVLKNDRLNWETRYRVHADLSYDIDIDPVTIQLRERLQYGFEELNSVGAYSSNKLVNRNRLKVEYDIFSSPLTLFGSGEFFVDLNERTPFLPSAIRFEAGVELMLSFKTDLEVSYMIDHELNDSNPLTAHVLVVGFSYKL